MAPRRAPSPTISAFRGIFFDQATYLHFNYFGDCDPRLGRYIESDPIGLWGGINTYAYAGGKPISRTDPTGLIIYIVGNNPTEYAAPQNAFDNVADLTPANSSR